MRIGLNEHFTLKKLLRFVLPTMVTIIFTQIYSIVDGIFVTNFAGKNQFAAINLIMPLLIIMGSLGFMLGTGGSALVAKTLGEGDPERANGLFSMMVIVMAIVGVILSSVGEIFIVPVARLLGASGETLGYCVLYGRFMLATQTFFILQNIFQSFFVVAEKARLGLIVTAIAGVMNIVLDALFVAVFKFGLAGAAAATCVSQIFGAAFPIVYFLRKNDSRLRLGKPLMSMRALLKACANGSSEFLSNIAASIITLLYNFRLLSLAGETGVAAYGAIMYVAMLLGAILFGYSMGVSPVISFNYGAKNEDELRNVYRKSMWIILILGVAMTVLAEACASPLSMLFSGGDDELYSMTLRGFRLYSISFLMTGFGMFGSAFFTALNNGLISAIISFSRTLVFQSIAVIVLPLFWALDGVWCAIVFAEIPSTILSLAFIFAYRKRYGYGKPSARPAAAPET